MNKETPIFMAQFTHLKLLMEFKLKEGSWTVGNFVQKLALRSVGTDCHVRARLALGWRSRGMSLLKTHRNTTN